MPSTSIRKFDYDPNTRVLSVWFVASGKHYEFLDVSAEGRCCVQSCLCQGRLF
ncbi:KTSC domain-containing protein [Mesorhizobium sp. M0016]|uniref:KTSC domain-containing protein n=1 Tax=Mesorhizobium sp. M0016 TaxID=2956843 RepID=UPI00333AC68F